MKLYMNCIFAEANPFQVWHRHHNRVLSPHGTMAQRNQAASCKGKRIAIVQVLLPVSINSSFSFLGTYHNNFG